jgi:hypothetical protein
MWKIITPLDQNVPQVLKNNPLKEGKIPSPLPIPPQAPFPISPRATNSTQPSIAKKKNLHLYNLIHSAYFRFTVRPLYPSKMSSPTASIPNLGQSQ